MTLLGRRTRNGLRNALNRDQALVETVPHHETSPLQQARQSGFSLGYARGNSRTKNYYVLSSQVLRLEYIFYSFRALVTYFLLPTELVSFRFLLHWCHANTKFSSDSFPKLLGHVENKACPRILTAVSGPCWY